MPQHPGHGVTRVAGVVLLAASAPAVAGDLGSSLLQMGLSLLLVLALLVGTLFLLQHLRFGQVRLGDQTLRVVASTAVGPRERVVVVELGDEWLVLGVGPGAVRLLQTRPRGQTPRTDATLPDTFAVRLARALGGRK